MKTLLALLLLVLPILAAADVINPNETPEQRAARIKQRQEWYRKNHPQAPTDTTATSTSPAPAPQKHEPQKFQPAPYSPQILWIAALGSFMVALLFIRRRRAQ